MVKSNKEKKLKEGNVVVYNIPDNEPLDSRPVIISSEFIQSSILPFLDKHQYALFIYSLAVIKENEKNLNNCKFKMNYFIDRTSNRPPKYADFVKSINELGKKTFLLKKSDGEYRQVNWFEFIEFDDENKFNIDTEVTFKIHNDLAPYLLQLQDIPYVKSIYKVGYKLGNTRNFHLYYILKSTIDFQKKYRQVVDKTFSLEDLNTIFSTKYRYSHIDREILKPAINLINEITELVVSYKPLKKGRAFNRVKFQIKYKPALNAPNIPDIKLPKPNVFDSETENISNQINQLYLVKQKGEKLNSITIVRLIEKYTFPIVQSELKEAIRKINSGEAKLKTSSTIGWIINQIKEQPFLKEKEIKLANAKKQQSTLDFEQKFEDSRVEIEKPAYLNKYANLTRFINLKLSDEKINSLLHNVYVNKKQPFFNKEISNAMKTSIFEPEKNAILVEIILREYDSTSNRSETH